MEIKWLGAAGFQISTGQDVFLLDPYLSRNPRAHPRQNLIASDLPAASRIFISHGHFDHILDVPPIARQTGADIYCAETTAENLIRNGVDEQKIHFLQGTEYRVFLRMKRFSNFPDFQPRLFSAAMSGLICPWCWGP